MQQEFEWYFGELQTFYNRRCKLLFLSYLGDYALWDGYIKRAFRKVFQYATLIHYILAHLVKYNKS